MTLDSLNLGGIGPRGRSVCVYLLLSYLKFVSQISASLQQILRLLQLNLFERHEFQALMRGDPPQPKISPLQTTLQFL